MSRLSILCPLYGLIKITPLIKRILNTPEVQRLRELKQLGVTNYVYPSANHTRLEHSIGVCHLAISLGRHLQQEQPTLKITERDIELWGIAGLVHDIGHGPYSHLYDTYIREPTQPEHEERGLKIFSNICERIPVGTTEEIDKVCEMIDPSSENKHNWIYQIVANKACDIDVDKIDYIRRDSYHVGISSAGELSRLLNFVRVHRTPYGLELTWDKKIEFDIFSLFANRYRMHREVYKHHTVCAFEYIITKILEDIRKQKPGIQLANQIDSIVIQYCYENPTHKYCEMLLSRTHPHLYDEHVIQHPEGPAPHGGFKELIHTSEYGTNTVISEDYTIGFVSGNKPNPLTRVYYYNGKELSDDIERVSTFNIAPGTNSFIIPINFKEVIRRMYYTNGVTIKPSELEEIWEGIKTQ